MFYTIYKITNIIDGKIYIGKHQTQDLNDDYMGSGKILKRSIAKHGIENFKKEILFQFDNEAEMNSKEAELVTDGFCLREDTYNLCPGGHGGWGYVNSQVWEGDRRVDHNRRVSGVKNLTGEQRRANSVKGGQARTKLLESGQLKPHPAWNKGTTISVEHRENISRARQGTGQGSSNSQFGIKFKWMNDGTSNKKVPLDEVSSLTGLGWVFGRK